MRRAVIRRAGGFARGGMCGRARRLLVALAAAGAASAAGAQDATGVLSIDSTAGPVPASAAPGKAAVTGPRLDGDIGLGVTITEASASGASRKTRPVPYAYADYGRLFAREDTLGVKLLPLGWGSLELAGRVSSEGTDADGPGLAHRRNPVPIGLGTFQETPWGGVFLNAFKDTVSGGLLLEASYAAQFALGPATLYPQVGVARRSARYADHLYGVSTGEAAAAGGRAYAPGASTVPVFGLSGELPLGSDWKIVAHVQRERFDRAIADSPRIDRAGQTSVLLALARHFD